MVNLEDEEGAQEVARDLIEKFQNNIEKFEDMEKCMILGNLIPIQYRFSYIKDEDLNERVNELKKIVNRLPDKKVTDKTLLEMYGILSEDCYMFGNDTLAIDYSLKLLEICSKLEGNPKSNYIKYTAENIL